MELVVISLTFHPFTSGRMTILGTNYFKFVAESGTATLVGGKVGEVNLDL